MTSQPIVSRTDLRASSALFAAEPTMRTLPGLRSQPLGADPAGKVVALRGDEVIDRARFAAEVIAWRAVLADRGWRRAALYFEDAARFAAALFGAWHAGLEVCVPTDAQATLERISEEVDAVLGDVPAPAVVLPAVSDGPGRAASGPRAFAELDPQNARLTLCSTSSSGELVMITRCLEQLEAEVLALEAAFGTALQADPLPLVAGTVTHQQIDGLLFRILWPLRAGRPFLASRLATPQQLALLPAGQPRVLVSCPTDLHRLQPGAACEQARTGLLALFSTGGSLSLAAAADAETLLGRSPTEVYGSTRTGGIAWRQRGRDGDRWTPLPGVQWRLEDGLLSVRSSRLSTYDWTSTGDRAQALVDGRFRLLGSAGGEALRIQDAGAALPAVERALLACAEIAQARVLPLGTTQDSELAVVAVLTARGREILLRDGRDALIARLRARLLESVERVALPSQWRYVDALPVDLLGVATEGALATLFQAEMPVSKWLELGSAEALAELDVHAALLVLDGHFPAESILPGVAQLDWAANLARECFPMPLRMARIEVLKFRRAVQPGTRVKLALNWDAETGTLSFRYTSAEGEHSSGRVVFEARNA